MNATTRLNANISKSMFFATLILAIIGSGPLSSSTENAPNPIVQDFTGVAKKAIPAVVSIKVKGTTKQKSGITLPWGGSDDSFGDLFGDDFLQKFFGMPRGNSVEQVPIQGQASGFLVSPDGIILTNSHVVKDANEITVILNDKREFTGKVLGQDPNTDIAVVKIDGNNLPYITLGNSADLQVGQWAIAIGNPMGLQASLTVGVISATGRNDLDLARIEDFIQTDAAINRGNSGGPLLNINGDVIGMNTAIVTNMATGGYMGIGFAIPSNLLKRVMDELIANGSLTRGFLGVSLQQLDANLAKAFNLEKTDGALIADVSKDSPAEKAGLKQGDIVLKYNGQSVTNIASLRNAIALMKPGTLLTMSVLRDGKAMDISIGVGAFPKDGEEEETEATPEPDEVNKYGFGVGELTPELAKSLGYKEEKGVIITKVDKSTPSGWAGLKKGTLILAVNQQKVSNVSEYNKALEALEKGKLLLLLIKQGEQIRFVSLQVN